MDGSILIASRDNELISIWSEALHGSCRTRIMREPPPANTLLNNAPALIILDAQFYESAQEAVSRYLEAGCKVLVVGQDWPEKKQIAAYTRGCSGYCEKKVNPLLARKAVETALRGDVWIQRELISRVIGILVQRGLQANQGSQSREKLEEALKTLSSREKEVVERIRLGESNKQVAEHLFISERTVKAHLSSIFRKLNVPDRLQLVVYLQQLNS